MNEYRIGREIGRGAYGTVLKARKPKQPEVAIKVAKRSALKRIRHGKGTALDSALREIAVMKRLSHPNVVQLIEVIDDPARDELYLVMELVTGGTLAEPIAKGQVSSEATLVRWMRGDDRTRARGYSGKVRPAYWWVVAGSASDKHACSHTSSMPVPVLTC